MYHARVMVASKVRKNDLPVKNGDTVSIIRTTSCPKGKWLARDANNRCESMSDVLFCEIKAGFKDHQLVFTVHISAPLVFWYSLALVWLFADGYISVMNVELNIKEMLELGKKAQAAGRGGTLEGDTISIGSRYILAPC